MFVIENTKQRFLGSVNDDLDCPFWGDLMYAFTFNTKQDAESYINSLCNITASFKIVKVMLGPVCVIN